MDDAQSESLNASDDADNANQHYFESPWAEELAQLRADITASHVRITESLRQSEARQARRVEFEERTRRERDEGESMRPDQVRVVFQEIFVNSRIPSDSNSRVPNRQVINDFDRDIDNIHRGPFRRRGRGHVRRPLPISDSRRESGKNHGKDDRNNHGRKLFLPRI